MSAEYWLLGKGGSAPPPAPPPPVTGLRKWPRYGMNISGLIVNTSHNVPETINRFVDAGVQLTDVNLMSAMWSGVDCMPFKIPPPGQRFDLLDFDNQFFERAHQVREGFNAQGVVVQGTLWELYSWSNRKKGEGIPDANVGPWRFNVNNITLGGAYNGDRKEDDVTLTQLIPTVFCKKFIPKIVPLWDVLINPIRLGNEMPEKSLHERLRDLIRAIEPKALTIVNRNEDTPGQYANMKIGRDYDMIEYHGRLVKAPDDLDRYYPPDVSSVPSFRKLLDNPLVDKKRITFSSDGARSGPWKDSTENPYEWSPLRELFQEVKRYGCNVLHQSRAKMTPAPNHYMIEVDWYKTTMS